MTRQSCPTPWRRPWSCWESTGPTACRYRSSSSAYGRCSSLTSSRSSSSAAAAAGERSRPTPAWPETRRARAGRTLKPIDWVELFRRIGAGVRGAVLPIAGTAAGRVRFEVGAGGDTTMEVDRAAEAVVFAELEAAARKGERFSVLSEESGLRG